MDRVILFAVLCTFALAKDENRNKCLKLGHADSLHCCKSGKPEPDAIPNDLTECIESPHIPLSCDREVCIAKKLGYASDDGMIDKKAFEAVLAKDVKKSPTLIATIKERCINGNVDKFGPPHLCPLIKINRCINVYYFLQCTEWDSSGNAACDNLRQLAKDCAMMLN